MKFRYFVNGKEMKPEDVRKTYGKKMNDTMLRAMGYQPKKGAKEKGA